MGGRVYRKDGDSADPGICEGMNGLHGGKR